MTSSRVAHRPLEIVHVIESLAHGGAEQNLLSQLKRLPATHFVNHLVWLYEDVGLQDKLRPHVASLTALRAGSGAGLIGAAWRLRARLAELRPHLVHAQLIRAQLVARTACAGLTPGVPIVTTWQNAYYDPRALADFAGSKLRRLIVRELDRWTGKRDAHHIAVSAHVADTVAKELNVDRSRVSVIFNAVEPARYAPVAADTIQRTRRELALHDDDHVLLAVGRLTPQKAHAFTVSAMTRVVEQNPRAKLLIAGRGPLEAALADQIRGCGLESHVSLLGNRADVPTLLQLADLFVFPSLYEGLSVALVEALANGLPAVVSNIPQNREITEDLPCVIYVPPASSGALADGLVAALQRLDTLKLDARRAAPAIQARFSADRLTADFANILTRVAAYRSK